MRTMLAAAVAAGTLAGSAGADTGTNERVIRAVFGAYGSQAVAVARCESGPSISTWAQNGQYLGAFQMGAYARSRFGHGSDIWTQARAAFAYFRASGYRWSAWSCKPY